MARKSLTFDCPNCKALQTLTLDTSVEAIDVPCGGCGKPITFTRLDQDIIEGCPLCGSFRLYQHKDFNKKIGLIVFLAGVIGSIVFYERVYYVPLALALIVDAALYPLFPWMMVCYQCQTELRGWPKNPKLDRFNHEVAAHYEYSQNDKTDAKSAEGK
jgi:hypothetical protein